MLGMTMGCGDVDEQNVSCAYLAPCDGLACYPCGWPDESCPVPQAEIVSANVPSTGESPFFVLIDIAVLSATQGPEEKVCEGAELAIRNAQGELLKTPLVLDQPRSFCSLSTVAGTHTITLDCPEGFPTRARYQVSIADSRASTMWP
jgi:hypothetical protein